MAVFIYLVALSICSLVTFILYVVDKKRAIDKAWRIPEKVLLGFSFFGGAVGGYFAMELVRHKTRRWYFHVVNLLGILWQGGLLVYLLMI